MKKYLVSIREVHVSMREVLAENEEAAIEMAAEGEGEEVLCEYSHTLDSDTWTVEERTA